jgi:hypothetical protein
MIDRCILIFDQHFFVSHDMRTGAGVANELLKVRVKLLLAQLLVEVDQVGHVLGKV